MAKDEAPTSGWWFQRCFFHFIWDVSFPIDELIFFKMGIAPPTRLGILMYFGFSHAFTE
jgi:DNA segregation ATPase FtsK/SpoIIIE-like protein